MRLAVGVISTLWFSIIIIMTIIVVVAAAAAAAAAAVGGMQTQISLGELWEDMTIHVGEVNKNVKAVHKDVIQLREDMSKVQKGIGTILENQASLVALFNEGEIKVEDQTMMGGVRVCACI